MLFVNTTLTQVDEEEAELFLTPGLTWTTGGNFAQAEVIISFLFVELWSRQESESINMVDAVNIFEKLYQIIKFQIKLKYNVSRVIHTSNTLHC